MIGHLHLLWWWALEIAPDGVLSAYDHADLADAAQWTGDPDRLVGALLNCGPGDAHGFLEPGLVLHDWNDYGGRYAARVAAGRKAAQARWAPTDADAMRTHRVTHTDRNTEERRGEEKKIKRKTRMTEDWKPDPANLDRLKEKYPKIDLEGEVERFRDHWIGKGEVRADWNASLRTWASNAETYRQQRGGERPGGWR